MPNLRAHIGNCFVAGHTFTENEQHHHIRDTIEFDCGGKIFVLKQKPEIITGKKRLHSFTGHFCRTSEILVKNVSESEVNKTLEEIDKLCWLLSFAGLSHVVRYGHDYPDGSTYKHSRTVFGAANNFSRPPIEIRDGEAVKSFIEQTYPNFCQYEKIRQLDVVFHYLLQAEQEKQPIECKLIFVSVLLENLKHTYGLEKKYEVNKSGYFLKPNSKKSYSFLELLEEMFGVQNMQPSLSNITALRNSIIHTGLFAKPFAELMNMYGNICDLLNEYLLRLLGFRGFMNLSDGTARKIT